VSVTGARLASVFWLLVLGGCGALAPSEWAPVDERGGQASGRAAPQPRETVSNQVAGEPSVTAPVGRAVVARSAETTVYRLGAESSGPPAALSEPSGTRGEAVNPAVIALVNEASDAQRDGKLDSAGASLERALKIEPDGAWLWHRLARIRLAQGDAARAEALAARSSSLAAGEIRLRADNWRLIAEARRLRGDARGVEEALAEAARLEQ
jgi:hypothetical protein